MFFFFKVYGIPRCLNVLKPPAPTTLLSELAGQLTRPAIADHGTERLRSYAPRSGRAQGRRPLACSKFPCGQPVPRPPRAIIRLAARSGRSDQARTARPLPKAQRP